MNFMNISQDKYGIGQPVSRSEDPLLLTGEGTFTDDISLPGQLYAYMIRSTIAHGNIISIDAAEAEKISGVHKVITGEDLRQYNNLQCPMTLKSKDGTPLKKPARPSLSTDKVRF